jgi:sugar phosphate isomerase/epimerase
MAKEPGASVLNIARRIPGLSGVELQMHYRGTTLGDRDTALSYKRQAEKAGLQLPSVAGVWPAGVSFFEGPAEETLRNSIQAAEWLGARVALVAAFNDKCPRMDKEESYEPVVALLQKVASAASDAGVTLGLETSLSPQEDKKLIDLVNRPSIRVYYDADNVERFGHKGEAVSGYEVLGKARIAQIHLKNESRLLQEPGRVDWTAALKAIARVGYSGWLVFESSHSGPEQCVDATGKNIDFIKRTM